MEDGSMLHFRCRGEEFKVNSKGELIQANRTEFSGQWKFLGVSFHHWRTGIDLRFEDISDPEQIIGGRVWDFDHGIVRMWSGSYFGKLPRITQAWEEK
jgi:hypothetical protein